MAIKKILKTIIFIFLIVLINRELYSEEPGSSSLSDSEKMDTIFSSIIAQIKEGYELLKKNDFQGALYKFESIERLYKDITPLIGDYMLFWQGDALMALSHEKALERFERIQRDYPSSPLKRRALMKIIEIKLLTKRDEAIKMLENYVSEFPQDEYGEYLLGYLYKESGRDAEDIFKRIYLKSGRFAHLAKDELKPDSLTPYEIFEKAKILMRQKRYSEAESLLNKILEVSDPLLKEDIHNSLGVIRFSLKRYSEASRFFALSGDYYMEALSLLRAGEKNSLKKLIEKLVRSRDRRVVPVAIAYARELRDNHEFKSSLDYLRYLLKSFPLFDEKLRWAIAWNYYITQNFRDAIEELNVLTTRYKRNQYLYWLVRARERSGDITPEEAKNFYREIFINDRSIYGFLSYMRLTDGIDKIYKESLSLPVQYLDDFSESDVESNDSIFMRFKILWDAGFKEDVISESRILLKRCSHENGGITPISFVFSNFDCRKFSLKVGKLYLKSGNYSKLLEVVPYFPDEQRINIFNYPLAYIDEVMESSRLNGIDPILIISLMREESRFNPEAVSNAGAVGLMQLMPQTALNILTGYREAGDINGDFSDDSLDSILMRPKINIRLGTAYFKSLITKYKNVFYSIAAYNAGEARVDRWLSMYNYSDVDEFIEDIPYIETLNYVKKVIGVYYIYNSIYRKELFELQVHNAFKNDE